MVKVLRSWVRGPLERHVVGFAEELLRQGYSPTSAGQHVGFVAHLDRWLTREGLGLADLSTAVMGRYLAERRTAGYVNYRSMKALQPLLAYLAPLKVLPPPEPVEPDVVEDVLDHYRGFLLGERGLSRATARSYLDFARPFLAGRARRDRLDLAGMTVSDVTGYVLATCPGRPVGSAKLLVTALRSLLGWLHLTGTVSDSLAAAVPSVAGWQLSGLPKPLESGELCQLLAACDRRRSTGRRDYAIMVLLARMGLRAGEVARLSLDDIDWRQGEIAVRGKGNRSDQLPLPDDVGGAIAAYLRRGRPADAQGRSVFIRVRAPHRALSSAGVSEVVLDAAQRACLPGVHAHRLRHTAATAMLRAGSPLPEVGLVLRHRSELSTAIYAKTDRDALAILARPWPAITTGSVR